MEEGAYQETHTTVQVVAMRPEMAGSEKVLLKARVDPRWRLRGDEDRRRRGGVTFGSSFQPFCF